MDRIADFLFEAGMLKRTPRTGWQFLGSGTESVAEHTFRTAVIAFALARLSPEVDADRVLRMALLHDLPEARTGDLNYMNQKYVRADEETAAADLTRGLPFGEEMAELLAEFRAQQTPEAVLAKDADHLEMLLQLKEHLDVGNRNAEEWIPFSLRRLKTDVARDLAQRILQRDSSAWWFDKDSEWWVSGGKT
ncbi:HD domain-containing protein [Deferrisoma camini]|uniref:HD domain-containing protein n=1 Tax=Deferrisoma camini TaxID=1035120 RepID=UPI00046D1DFD|nr:HD domain-containing protein [Deferrisoma camini]